MAQEKFKGKTILEVILLALTLLPTLTGNFLPQVNATPTGNAWGEQLTGMPWGDSKSTQVDVDSEGRIFVGTRDAGLYKSEDSGSSWTRVLSGIGGDRVFGLYVTANDTVIVQINGFGTLRRSTDYGSTWATVNLGGNTTIHDILNKGWVEDSNGYIYTHWYGPTGGSKYSYVYRSIDNGTTFLSWYNASADQATRHIHDVEITSDSNYMFVATGDPGPTPTWCTIRRYNFTSATWEILVNSSETNDNEPRATGFLEWENNIITLPDYSKFFYRFPITGTWAQRERILSTTNLMDNEFYDAIKIGDVGLISSDSGQIAGTWDGEHWVKIYEDSSGANPAIWKMQKRKSFPLYYTTLDHRLFRINRVTKEDLVYLYYKVFNADRGYIDNSETYIIEQRIGNGTNYLDLTGVALSNVQASIKGLSQYNNLSNSGFETGSISTEWQPYNAGSITVADTEQHDGTYCAELNGAHLTALRQNVKGITKGSFVLVSFWLKANDTLTNKLKVSTKNYTSGGMIASYWFSADTSWSQHFINQTFTSSITWDYRIEFWFQSGAHIQWFDSAMVVVPKLGYQRIATNDDEIAYANCFSDAQTYWGSATTSPTPLNTTNPTLTINGQEVSYSGEMENGAESSAISLSGIFTGSVQVDANIQGSGQAILRITGTRVIYEDSIIFKGRTQNVYYGRYYGTLSLTINTTDLLALTNLQANITSLSFDGSKLTLIVDSPSGTTSTTKVHCGDKTEPTSVLGATSWNYNSTSKILTTTANHSSSIIITVKWKFPGDVNGDGIVNILDLSRLGKAFGAKPTDPNWDKEADINSDNIVDVSDLSILGKNYGKTS